MAKTGCPNGGACPYKPLWWIERVVVTALVSGAVLARPLANAVGLGFDQSIASAHPVFNVSSALIVLAWAAAIYVAYKDDADHHWTVVINAIGLPGFLLTLVLMLSK